MVPIRNLSEYYQRELRYNTLNQLFILWSPFVCVCFLLLLFWETGFTMKPRLFWNSLCSPHWLQTCNPPDTAFQVLSDMCYHA